MKKLPQIGRPSKSGLSIKELGAREYSRIMSDRRRRKLGKAKRRMTGLSVKILGSTNYRFAYRFLNR